MCYYQGIGAPKDDPTPDMIGWQTRGNVIAEYFRNKRLPIIYNPTEIKNEVEVPWPKDDPVGVGHADHWVIPPSSTVVEVKSATKSELHYSAVLQCGGYARNMEAKNAKVVVIDPSSFSERWIPVKFNSKRLSKELDRIEEVASAAARGEKVDRVCSHPGDGPAFFCPYVGECFDGWEPPGFDSLYGAEELIQRLVELTESSKTNHGAKAELESLRKYLLGYLEPGQQYLIGKHYVKVSPVAGRKTFDLKSFERTGHDVTEEMSPFLKVSKDTHRWTVREVEEDG